MEGGKNLEVYDTITRSINDRRSKIDKLDDSSKFQRRVYDIFSFFFFPPSPPPPSLLLFFSLSLLPPFSILISASSISFDGLMKFRGRLLVRPFAVHLVRH